MYQGKIESLKVEKGGSVMNTTFITKMLRAKKLEYEAIKEIMPECVKGRWEEKERNLKDTFKEVALEFIKEETKHTMEQNEEDAAKKTKKVHVEF